MLAQLEKPTNDFHALASYLVHGRTRPTPPNRVAWTIARNLPTDDPKLAATIMAATAELSKRCTNAAYHAIIAWALDERPTPEQMQAVALRTLELAGLDEHQAIIMGHGDRPHAHLHMLINRVHPDTGRAWSTSHDYKRFDRIMHQVADEQSFQYVPAHAFNPDLTEHLPKKPNSKATWASRRGAPTDRVQWSRITARQLGQNISERIDRATTWEDIEEALAGEGLALEAKGQGLVAGDATGYVKFSALKLTGTAKGFEKRFGRPFPRKAVLRRRPTKAKPFSPTRRVLTVDAVDVAKALGGREDVRSAVQDAQRRRRARIATKPVLDQLLADLREQLKATTALSAAKTRRIRPRRRAPNQSRDR